ncbi:MAG: hypothetical protein JNM57_14775 [Cyclobacteriaceae bacterium]|nr:hypothetical protein [Cyclobacteriaceae bacterium]
MKTHDTFNILSNTRIRVRVMLALVGIVAAIFCLLTLIGEVHPTANTKLLPSSEIMPVSFSGDFNTITIVSVLWPFQQ